MDPMAIANYVLGAGFIAIAVALVRWGYKVDQNFAGQAVINEKFIGALNTLQAKLEGHAELDETRLAALERRVELSENRPVASNGGRRHPRIR